MFPIRDDRPTYTPPIVTTLLIVACALVFFHELSLADAPPVRHLLYRHFYSAPLPSPRDQFINTYALIPSRLTIESLITSLFLHAGWAHIIGNMLFLWAFGRSLEDAMGHAKFLGFYLMCGVAAGLVHVLFNYYSVTPTVGASGAIAGVMGAYLLKFPRAWIRTLVVVIVFITTVDIPAWFFVIFWFVTQVFNGYGSIAQTQVSDTGTAWFAHIGGFLAGMLLVSVMGTRNRYVRRQEAGW